MKTLLTNVYIGKQRQNLLIDGEYIAYVGPETKPADRVLDLQAMTVIPAMIDPHTHIRDLGRTDKEDWLSASYSALKGGVTMVFDMPNTKPPTLDLDSLNLKREAARKALIRYKFNLGTTAHNLDDARRVLETKPEDVAALKIFIAGSNSREYVDDPDVIRRVFELGKQYDLPVMVHSEWQACIDKHATQIPAPTIYDHNSIRHRTCAIKSTELVLELAADVGNVLYLAHTSVAGEMDLVRAAKRRGVRVICEITPHHLLINESVLPRAGNYGKVNPPLRTERDNEALWEALGDGTVDLIGSDHAPHRLDEKQRPYPEAPSGFPGLETSLPLLLYEVRKGHLDLDKLVELTATRAAGIFGLPHMGRLEAGYLADLAVVDLRQTEKIRAANFLTKAKYSPYEGMDSVPVQMTFINGKLAYDKTKHTINH